MSKEEEKNQLNKLKEQFSRGNRENPKGKPPGNGGDNGGKKVNFYWVYIALFVLFIGIQIFGSLSVTS
jgi:hypothetical protein